MYCVSVDGEPVQVSDDELLLAPAAYGILLEAGRVLLERHPASGLLAPPGIRVPPERSPTAALKAHFRTLIGLTPEIGALFHTEAQHRLDEMGQAWRLIYLYYSLRRPPGQMATLSSVDLQWLSLADLSPTDMQFGLAAIRAAAPWS